MESLAPITSAQPRPANMWRKSLTNNKMALDSFFSPLLFHINQHVSSFSDDMIKYSNINNLNGKDVYFRSQFKAQYIMAGKSRQQDS